MLMNNLKIAIFHAKPLKLARLAKTCNKITNFQTLGNFSENVGLSDIYRVIQSKNLAWLNINTFFENW